MMDREMEIANEGEENSQNAGFEESLDNINMQKSYSFKENIGK